MKTAISVPDETFRRVDERAGELGISRSEFYATAARRYLDHLDEAGLTGRIDLALTRSGTVVELDDDAVTTQGRAELAALTADDEW